MKEKFLDVFKEALEIEDREVSLEDDFREYEEWDSLAQLSLIAALDEEFGAAVEDEAFQQLKTVGDLFKAVQEQAS
ncbi:acyl carrier protein [Cyclonatronum proteinivorum]|uniref:Acyl carrier protein n=1 Tax=Cyclonatronum proteinivorum TaxID=1457365 RepID=A0A345UMF9_9BACT|nr:acyl carrier protein [Cyclonatronum proteinivorum]AXJ01661.1 acyl carrier protein [Cyclonatronum proteinivorum]